MHTNEIRRMIKEAGAIEDNTRALADCLVALAGQRGIQLTPRDVAEGVAGIRSYIEHAPAVLDQIYSAASEQGVAGEVAPILGAAEQYFLAPFDLIPDHLGLLGLVDDAYLAQRLVQAISDHYKAQTGKSMLSVDLTQMNMFIRGLIGEPHATLLDNAIAETLGQKTLDQMLQPLIAAAAAFGVSGPDPTWGNATPAEIANVQLGAWGVV